MLRVQEKKVSRVCWQNIRHVCTEKEEGRVAEVAFLIFRGVLISPRAENAQQYDRSWSGGCIVLEQIWGDTPRPRAKEKPQKDSRRSKIMIRINPISDKDAQRAQTSLVHTRTQRPHRDWARTVFEGLLWKYSSAVACHRGKGFGCSRPGCGISSLGRGYINPTKSHQNFHRTRETDLEGTNKNLCAPRIPGERSSDPRFACEYPGVSGRDMGQKWPAAGSGALSASNSKKDVLFVTGNWNAKVRNQGIPGVTGKFGLGVQNEAGQSLTEFNQTTHWSSKHPLPTTQEKTLHMDFNRWSILKSDWLYFLQSKMEKLYTVSKNKTGSWLWLRSWIHCKIKT